MRLRTKLQIANVVLLSFASVVYIFDHGGLRGDYVFLPEMIGNDVVADLADIGQVMFNRWRFYSNTERVLVRIALYADLPSFLVAATCLRAAGYFNDEMRTGFPFGVCYLTYMIVGGMLLSLVQWYWVGRIVEALLARRKDKLKR